MKKVFICYLFSALILPAKAQKLNAPLQAGVSALPIFDAFKLYPGNDISGLATTVNFGCFIFKNVSFGINPYYGKVTNGYSTAGMNPHREKQDLTLVGLNTYLRYYIINGRKFLFYSILSGGLAHLQTNTTNLLTGQVIENYYSNEPAYTFQAGIGANYFITKNLSLELNLPYTLLNYTAPNSEPYFQTLIPTFGLQFFWGRSYEKTDAAQKN